jgi:putative phosphoesterase
MLEMKIAIISDIHDNEARLSEALKIIKAEKIKICVCLGDISRLSTLQMVAKPFKKFYLALGNMDHNLKGQTELFPENVKYWEQTGDFKLNSKHIAIVHNDKVARTLAKDSVYDYVFYGHTHTPWEKKVGKTILLNPGEVSGQFGPASFAVLDLSTMKAKLKLLK